MCVCTVLARLYSEGINLKRDFKLTILFTAHVTIAFNSKSIRCSCVPLILGK